MRKRIRKLVATTRSSGNGEIAKSNKKFKASVKDSGELVPKYGRALAVYTATTILTQMFN